MEVIWSGESSINRRKTKQKDPSNQASAHSNQGVLEIFVHRANIPTIQTQCYCAMCMQWQHTRKVPRFDSKRANVFVYQSNALSQLTCCFFRKFRFPFTTTFFSAIYRCIRRGGQRHFTRVVAEVWFGSKEVNESPAATVHSRRIGILKWFY